MDKREIIEEMKKLCIEIEPGGEYPVQDSSERFVTLQKLMREWFKHEQREGNFLFSDHVMEKMEKHHGHMSLWLDDWLDESTEEWLVG